MSVCATPVEIPLSSLPRFVCRRHSDAMGKEGELFVEHLGLDKDVLHPALPLRHTRTRREHGRTVNTRPLVLSCESQRIVSTLALIKKTQCYCGPGREHKNFMKCTHYLSPSSDEVTNEWSYTSAAPICLPGLYMHNCTFTSYQYIRQPRLIKRCAGIVAQLLGFITVFIYNLIF